MYSNLLGEFLGTMVLIIFGCGAVANVTLKKSKAEGGGWIVITTGWACGVVMGIFLAEATGAPQADINPAVTLAKFFIGIYGYKGAIITMLFQVGGAFFGAFLITLFYGQHWRLTDDTAAKLGVFCTSPAVRNRLNAFFCEVMSTVLLIIAVFAIFSKLDGYLASHYGPYLVGILVWGIGLSLGGTTGYAINPARDLGPRIAHAILPIPGKGDSDWGYAWIPVAGPLTGGVIAFGLSKLFGLV